MKYGYAFGVRKLGDCLKTYYGAGFQPFSLLLVPYPRASPWAVIDRAFGAQIAVIARLKSAEGAFYTSLGQRPRKISQKAIKG
jgi:hypothetical protein